MKSMPAVATLFVLAAIVTGSGWNYQETAPMVARLTKVVRDVEVRSSSASDWHAASANSELTAGFEVRTKKSSFVMVAFKDGSKVTVRERSVIKILAWSADNERPKLGFFISQGQVAFDLKSQSAGFQIATPNCVALMRRVQGAVSFEPKTGEAMFTVGTGKAEISGTLKDCKLVVPAGHSAKIDSTGCRLD